MDKKYRKYFHDRLCKDVETLKQYRKLFDTKRTPEEKRKEFKKNYKRLLEELMRLEGFKSANNCKCLLQYSPECDINSGITIDHIIPLSSNKINKEVRHIKAKNGKKVETESLGSNDFSNLIICCKNCNFAKKHIILDAKEMKNVLKRKSRVERRNNK